MAQPCAVVPTSSCLDDIIHDGYQYKFVEHITSDKFGMGDVTVDIDHRFKYNALVCDSDKRNADGQRLVLIKYTQKEDVDAIEIVDIYVYSGKRLLLTIPCDGVVEVQTSGPFLVTETADGKYKFYNMF